MFEKEHMISPILTPLFCSLVGNMTRLEENNSQNGNRFISNGVLDYRKRNVSGDYHSINCGTPTLNA